MLSNPDLRIDERAKIAAEAPDKIKEALKFIRNQLFEVNRKYLYHHCFVSDNNIVFDIILQINANVMETTFFVIFVALDFTSFFFFLNNALQVPFIAFYRKEYVESCLVINDLWKVYQWDEKVILFLFEYLLIHT